MQTRFVLRTTALLLSAAALSSCATPSNSITTKAASGADARTAATLPAELSVAHPALYRAWQGKDPLAMRPWYVDNAMIVATTDIYRGWNDMHARWLEPTLKAMSNFMAMPTSFTHEGDDIIEVGRYSFTVTQDGVAQEVRGGYAQRWQRQPNGNWRVATANIVRDPPRK